jgi:hypothetical protein
MSGMARQKHHVAKGKQGKKNHSNTFGIGSI